MYSHDDAKVRARKVRSVLKELGHDISHATALELVARQHNFKDWNTCVAALEKRGAVLPIPSGWYVGGDQTDNYDVGIEQSITYQDINPAVIRYKHTASNQATGYATLTQSFDPVDFRGKRVQFSSPLKCDGCNGAVTIWLRADSDTQRATNRYYELIHGLLSPG